MLGGISQLASIRAKSFGQSLLDRARTPSGFGLYRQLPMLGGISQLASIRAKSFGQSLLDRCKDSVGVRAVVRDGKTRDDGVDQRRLTRIERRLERRFELRK